LTITAKQFSALFSIDNINAKKVGMDKINFQKGRLGQFNKHLDGYYVLGKNKSHQLKTDGFTVVEENTTPHLFRVR